MMVALGGCSKHSAPAAVDPDAARAIHMMDAGVCWDWVGERLMRTVDGGKTWKDVTPSSYARPAPGKTQWGHGGECFFDAQTALFYEGSYQTNAAGLFDKDTSVLWRTTDGGATWTSTPNDNHPQELHFTDDKNGWAVSQDIGAGSCDSQYFATSDGGATWSVIPFIAPGATPGGGTRSGEITTSNIAGEQMAYYPPAKAIITFDNTLDDEKPRGIIRILLTTNLGKTWHDLALPIPVGKFHDDFFHVRQPVFFDAQHGLMAVDMFEYAKDAFGEISSQHDAAMIFYTTEDGGETWTPGAELPADAVRQNGNYSFGEMFAFSMSDMLVHEGVKLHVTHDGGKNWQTVTPRFSPVQSTPDAGYGIIHFLDEMHGANAVFNEKGQHALFQTFDGGAIWSQFPLADEHVARPNGPR